MLLLARDVASEGGEELPPIRLSASTVVHKVADKALLLGCGLAFQSEGQIYKVFDHDHQVRRPCNSAEETGHIPKSLYQNLAESGAFSPTLNQLFIRFARDYGNATQRQSITNERESELVFRFASSFARSEPRLFFPLERVQLLRHYEMTKANKRTRDHFFHTFNNLFLGFHILGRLFRGRRRIAEVDRFIEARDGNHPGPHAWESLWFITCMFHDPAYVAEKFWGTFRFSYGVAQGDSSDDEELPAILKQQTRSFWEGPFLAARQDLRDLYDRTIKRWIPPSIVRSTPDYFDAALEKAYFDGRNTPSHSLVSGLSLINLCRTSDVPRPPRYDPQIALIACEIAALSMMFHDPRCRAVLTSAKISPIPFERLPYAALLMFVDSLQEDRRDISKNRFRKHGALHETRFGNGDPRSVTAVVCLRELPPRTWAFKIAEYESVMSWIRAKSKVRFTIDYKTRAGI